MISIGGPVPSIPALPGGIDGPQVRGLATHGRFEGESLSYLSSQRVLTKSSSSLAGDVSMTRQDAAIGDNRNFQVDLYDTVCILHSI